MGVLRAFFEVNLDFSDYLRAELEERTIPKKSAKVEEPFVV